MKKKSTGILMVLLLSMIININYVKANVTAYGEQWENECKYNGGPGHLTIYIKSGKSLIIKEFVQTSYTDTLLIYNGKDEQKLGNWSWNAQVLEKRLYTLKNNIIIGDGKCPVVVYENYDSYVGNDTHIWLTYSTSDIKARGQTNAYFIEGGSSSSSGRDSNGYENCGGIIDATTKKIINKYLGYIHIIVPIMVLALGVYDFFRAMIASKEDEMKKAQKRFIIRLIAGVLVFLAPTIVNIIIDIFNNAVTDKEACKLLSVVQNNAHL